MHAMRAKEFNGYEGLKLVNLPKPAVSDGKVLVRMTAAGVTPLEHTILSGQFPLAKAPLILGNEGAGVVEQGGGTDFPAGQSIAALPLFRRSSVGSVGLLHPCGNVSLSVQYSPHVDVIAAFDIEDKMGVAL